MSAAPRDSIIIPLMVSSIYKQGKAKGGQEMTNLPNYLKDVDVFFPGCDLRAITLLSSSSQVLGTGPCSFLLVVNC